MALKLIALNLLSWPFNKWFTVLEMPTPLIILLLGRNVLFTITPVTLLLLITILDTSAFI